MDRVLIVGIGGSNREHSRSLAALAVALEGAERSGAETKLVDIRTLKLPFYTREGAPPEAARRFVDLVYRAHGLLWSSPLYHGTISGMFKNALDWLDLLREQDPPFLTDKIVGLISTAGGVQGLQAINTMEFVVRALRGWTVPLVMPVPRADQTFDDQGRPQDPRVAEQLRALGTEVVRAARQFADLGYCDYSDVPVVQTSGRGTRGE